MIMSHSARAPQPAKAAMWWNQSENFKCGWKLEDQPLCKYSGYKLEDQPLCKYSGYKLEDQPSKNSSYTARR